MSASDSLRTVSYQELQELGTPAARRELERRDDRMAKVMDGFPGLVEDTRHDEACDLTDKCFWCGVERYTYPVASFR